MKPKDQVHALLKEHGAVLTRWHKHFIWKLPNGKTITISKTASDVRAWRNTLSNINRALSIKKIRKRKGKNAKSIIHK